MGPVNLNKDHNINKAGVEVDIIPIMRSPCPSPKPSKKNTRRSKSAMGYYNREYLHADERGSLPDLQYSSVKGSLLNLVQLNPDRFLSTESLISGERAESLGSTGSLPKGTIMNAVVNWLQKSSPFSSTDNIDKRSLASIPDTMDTSISIFDDEELEISEERSTSRSEGVIPDINVFSEENNLSFKTEAQLGKFLKS